MRAGISSGCAGFVAATGLILTLLALPAYPETDDGDFNYCLETLHHSPFKLTHDRWHAPPLPNDVEKIERPIQVGDLFVRWAEHKNQDGTTTYVVLRRDPERDQPAFDPDGFDVVLKQGTTVSFKDNVSANAFAFSVTQRHGVNALLFCEEGDISPLWNWTGSDWHP